MHTPRLRWQTILALTVLLLICLRSLLVVVPLYPSRLHYNLAKLVHGRRCLDPDGQSMDPAQERSKWSPRRLWIDGRGRLGNGIFNFIGALGIARTNEREFYVTPKLAYLIWEVFDTSSTSFGVCEIPKVIYNYHVPFASYDSKTEDLTFADTVITSYTQSWKYFQKYEIDIRRILKFHDVFLRASSKFLLEASRKVVSVVGTPTFIGVHVRRGDIAEDSALHTNGFKAAPISFLEKVLQYYRDKYQNVVFIVCSDDIEWCESQTVFKQDNVVFSRGYSEGFDLALLSQCNHTVITVGTFSWWAGWLAGGDVVYYDEPYRKNSILSQAFTSEDYFLTEWIRIGD